MAIGESLGKIFYSTSRFFAAFLIGFLTGWQLSLIAASGLPILIISIGLIVN